VDAEANHAGAALAGSARGFIGNTRPSRSRPSDLRWFIGLSALGHGPARAVQLLEALRRWEGREASPSLLYIGDAAQPAWELAAAATPATVTLGEGSAVVAWPGGTSLYAAELACARVTALARDGRLSASTDEPFAGEVAVLPCPDDDRLLVLVDRVSRKPLELRLSECPPGPSHPGSSAAGAIRRLAVLARTEAFADVLAPGLARLEKGLGRVCQSLDASSGIHDLPGRRRRAAAAESSLASALDAKVAERGRDLSLEGWLLTDALEATSQTWPAPGSPCPGCGATTFEYVARPYSDLEDDHERVQQVCEACGTLADLARWPLQVRLLVGRWTRTDLSVSVEVTNGDAAPRRASLSIAVQRVRTRPLDGRSVRTVEMAPGETVTVGIDAALESVPRDFHWLRLHVASHGALGAVSCPLVLAPS
jgi:hypothetical protein